MVSGRHGKSHGQAGQPRHARGQGHAGHALQRQLALVIGAGAPQLLPRAHEEAVARPRADLDAIKCDCHISRDSGHKSCES